MLLQWFYISLSEFFCTYSMVEAKKSEVFTYICADILLIMVDGVIVVLVIVIDCRKISVVIQRIDCILIFSERYWGKELSSQESEKKQLKTGNAA